MNRNLVDLWDPCQMQHLHQTINTKLDLDVMLKLDRAVLVALTRNDKSCLEKSLRELTMRFKITTVVLKNVKGN